MALDRKGALILLGLGALALAGGDSSGPGPAGPGKDGPQIGPPPPPPGNTPSAVLASLIKPKPTPGFLYQVQGDGAGPLHDDNITEIIREAHGLPVGDPRILPLIHAAILTRWNWILYGVQALGIYSAQFPGTTLRGSLAAAFYPGNDNVADAIAQGELPRRLYQWSRTPNPNQAGTFFPPVGNGRPAHGPRGYGLLMVPKGPGPVDDPARNPSALFAALGKTLADLQP